MRTLAILMTAAVLGIGASVGLAEDEPVQPGASPSVSALVLPLKFEKGQSINFQVSSLPSAPVPEDDVADGADAKGGAAAAAKGHVPVRTRYRLDVREVTEHGVELYVSVQAVRPRPTPSGAGARKSAPAPGNAETHSFSLRLDANGVIRDVQGLKLSAEDRLRLELMVGSGLHGVNLREPPIRKVSSLWLQLDKAATKPEQGEIVFAILPPRADGTRPHPKTEGAQVLPKDKASKAGRVVYGANDGLLKQLTPLSKSQPGMERFEIERLQENKLARSTAQR